MNPKESIENITVIGLVGQPSSGKDTAAHYLERRGFVHVSTGDLLREDMVKAGIQLDRPHMNEFAITMRKKYGNSYPASRAVEKIVASFDDGLHSQTALKNVVISGMRNISEIEAIRQRFGGRFFLFAVEAPIEIRYERARARNRVGDNITFEQFKAQEDFERKTSDGTYQMDAMTALADMLIKNDVDEAHFFADIDACLKRTA